MPRILPSAFLILGLAASCAFAQSPQEEAIKRRGFDFRPKQETPWGVKLEAPQRLSWIEANGARYKVDPGAAIPPGAEDRFMRAYLKRYAAQEVALVAELLLGAPPSVQVSLGSPRISSFSTALDELPVTQYRVEFRDAKVGHKALGVQCRFMFIAHQGSAFLVYSKMGPYSDRENLKEPHCDPQG